MLRIVRGPYLQNPLRDAITIRWETSEECSGEVRVYDTYMAHVPMHQYPVKGDPRVFKGESARFHSIQVDGLETGHDYYYEVISETEAEQSVSRKFSFRTAPDETTAFSFVLTAENGGIVGTNPPYAAVPEILEQIRRERPDFIMSVGDIVNAGVNPVDWDVFFFAPFRKVLANTPFFPCVGNHEVAGNFVKDEDMEERYANYLKYFAFDRNYSFDYGCAHFCVLDCPSLFEAMYETETDQYMLKMKRPIEETEQYRFLEKDLAQTQAKWKFVVFHYPPYTSSIYGVWELQALCPLFEKYGVDVVFNSHAIVYERSHPVKDGHINKEGIRYILVGGYGDKDDWFRDKSNGLSAKLHAGPNYVRVAMTPWSFELQAYTNEGKLFDTLMLEK